LDWLRAVRAEVGFQVMQPAVLLVPQNPQSLRSAYCYLAILVLSPYDFVIADPVLPRQFCNLPSRLRVLSESLRSASRWNRPLLMATLLRHYRRAVPTLP